MMKMFNKAKVRRPLTGTKGLILSSLIVGSLALPLITHAGQHPRYKLIDLGTFGGPSSTFEGLSKTINNHGTAVGTADTAFPDPFAPNCFGPNCVVQHAFQWKHGVLTDLGALPGGSSSWAEAINEAGQIVGRSENGLIDPLTGAPEQYAVLWKDGRFWNARFWDERNQESHCSPNP